jgi:hypothetical protein
MKFDRESTIGFLAPMNQWLVMRQTAAKVADITTEFISTNSKPFSPERSFSPMTTGDCSKCTAPLYLGVPAWFQSIMLTSFHEFLRSSICNWPSLLITNWAAG